MGIVIKFPTSHVNPPLDEDELISSVDNIKYNHIEETLAVVLPMLFNNLDLASFDFESVEEEIADAFIKDGSFLVESIRSMMCKYHGIYHPFQEIAEQIFQQDEDGNYNLAKRIELDLVGFKVERNSES